MASTHKQKKKAIESFTTVSESKRQLKAPRQQIVRKVSPVIKSKTPSVLESGLPRRRTVVESIHGDTVVRKTNVPGNNMNF